MRAKDTLKVRAGRAQSLLNDLAFQEACATLEKKLKDDWAASLTAEHREELWHKLHALSSVKTELSALHASARLEVLAEAGRPRKS